MMWSLMVHGGAGILRREDFPVDQAEGARAGLRAALAAGEAVLAGGGAALDAVEAAVRVLEDDPHFNAGRGAVLSYDGCVSLDAAIMDGPTRAAGAVAGVSAARNPVSLARRVMTATPHVLLSGAGADQFARDQEVECAGQEWFATPERRRQLEELRAKVDGWFDAEMKYGTVGAVARDAAGHVAAATSTGGVMGKRWGRIGDTPLIGAGTFADDRACAVSATGSGEYFIRANVAAEIAARVRLTGAGIGAAADAVLAEVRALGGTGGVIITAPNGEMAWRFVTPGMFRGCVSEGAEARAAIFGDEG
ncbi:MAG: isoaspartyl peptidase/L-asparaginase [Sphingomonas sp.]|uniref:isoaspartyl peptidase/L-asparaginase family protein n=1 Tax=Sphingomonas sp. TaxID=28214 RepID=UPI0025D6CADE|nr:isoaspartyl peptidase/L-asparaginase [Sphingomonas sp.]MBX9881390.1 isoaspartyl peptidase/L-asparaginase [Sphingomonas sp.]